MFQKTVAVNGVVLDLSIKTFGRDTIYQHAKLYTKIHQYDAHREAHSDTHEHFRSPISILDSQALYPTWHQL